MEEKHVDGEIRWAIVELFGHQRIAGRISDEVLGGQSFIRIDVPTGDGVAGFTKLFGSGAIYGITFVSEEIATGIARKLRKEPVSLYELPEEYARAFRQMRAIEQPTATAGSGLDDEDDEEEF